MNPNCSQKGGEIETPRAQEHEKSSNAWTDLRKVHKMVPKRDPKSELKSLKRGPKDISK